MRDDTPADGTKSDIIFQTSDTTWQAYNGWAGNNGQVGANFYGDASGTIDHDPVADPGLGAQDRAYAVSYNRPFITRDGAPSRAAGAQEYLFGADYAAMYWLEKNGYDVTTSRASTRIGWAQPTDRPTRPTFLSATTNIGPGRSARTSRRRAMPA